METEIVTAEEGRRLGPPVGVSVVIFSVRPETDGCALVVLLVRRASQPDAGRWALPGGWVRLGEGLEEAARRHLQGKTGLQATYLEQLYTFGRPDRDPREHRIAVAYYALVPGNSGLPEVSQGASEAQWFPVDALPSPLAFDNDRIVQYALWRLRNKVSYGYVAYRLLPPTFTLTQLREVYEAILGAELDPTNFRRKVEASGTVAPTGKRVEGGAHRPPQLYQCTLTSDQIRTRPPG